MAFPKLRTQISLSARGCEWLIFQESPTEADRRYVLDEHGLLQQTCHEDCPSKFVVCTREGFLQYFARIAEGLKPRAVDRAAVEVGRPARLAQPMLHTHCSFGQLGEAQLDGIRALCKEVQECGRKRL